MHSINLARPYAFSIVTAIFHPTVYHGPWTPKKVDALSSISSGVFSRPSNRQWFAYMDPQQHPQTAEEIFGFPMDKYSESRVDEASRKLDNDSHIYFGHSTAREVGWLLEKMVQGTLVSKVSSALMLDILKKQQVNDRFPRYLRNVPIAHKTGDDQPYIANDAGVLWVKNKPIVLVVFTAHHRGTTGGLHDAIARVAAYTVRHFGGDLSPDFQP